MKQRLLILLLLSTIISPLMNAMCATGCNISAHTTLIPRRMSQNSVLELSLHDYYQYSFRDCGECPPNFFLEVTAPYFFKSTKSKKLASYFLPNCQNCVSIGENNSSDISSPWLQLSSRVAATPYRSVVCLEPERKVIGGALRFHVELNRIFENCGCLGENWWFSVFIPIQQVRHNIHITETFVPGSPLSAITGIPNAIVAFNNPAWNYGKWSPNTLRKTGIDDICVKIGNAFHKSRGHTDLYALLFIPTGSGTKAKYLFEPLVGSNHVGLGIGFNGDYIAYECDTSSINFMIDARYAYFLKHKETRSIDLFNGDLSRYLLVTPPPVVPPVVVTTLPGINYFTQEVDVKPQGMFEIFAAVSFNQCDWSFEIGYDFWYRSKEKLKLADKDLGVGIFDIASRPPVCPVSASCARICQAVPGVGAPVSDTTFVTVKNSEAINDQDLVRDGKKCCPTKCAAANQCSYLNLDSAANPRAATSTIYAAIAHDCCCCDRTVMVGVGAQYEFSHRRSALSQFGVWLKSALSF